MLHEPLWPPVGAAPVTPPRTALTRSPLPLRERIEAASAAGLCGFGLLSADVPAAEKEYGLKGVHAVLDDNGIADLDLEGSRTGGTTGHGGKSPTCGGLVVVEGLAEQGRGCRSLFSPGVGEDADIDRAHGDADEDFLEAEPDAGVDGGASHLVLLGR